MRHRRDKKSHHYSRSRRPLDDHSPDTTIGAEAGTRIREPRTAFLAKTTLAPAISGRLTRLRRLADGGWFDFAGGSVSVIKQ